MIIVRSPLRITLGGGGSDIPAYYQEHGGFCVAAAIDKYVYVAITKPFYPDIFLKYSKLERVHTIDDIQHTRIREALRRFPEGPIEITSLADIPAGTGLGSSSSFTVALILALSAYYRQPMTWQEVAAMAFDIEVSKLKEPIGRQDQLIAAHGGIVSMEFGRDGEVNVKPLVLSPPRTYDLEDNLLLFFSGIERDTASSIRVPSHDAVRHGKSAKETLETGSPAQVGEMLNEQWRHKPCQPPQIAEWREAGLRSGPIGTGSALGAKLVGAGGGGFLLFYSQHHRNLRRTMAAVGLQECRFRFDYEGAKVLLS